MQPTLLIQIISPAKLTNMKFCNDMYTVSDRVRVIISSNKSLERIHTHTFNDPFPGLPGWAGTRKVKSIWILLKQEAVSGSGISWAIHKTAPSSRQITMPAPHHSVFLQARCHSCRPTNIVKTLKAIRELYAMNSKSEFDVNKPANLLDLPKIFVFRQHSNSDSNSDTSLINKLGRNKSVNHENYSLCTAMSASTNLLWYLLYYSCCLWNSDNDEQVLNNRKWCLWCFKKYC